MKRVFLLMRVLFVLLLISVSSVAWAQDDFAAWTKFKLNHKIDSRFGVYGDLEIRTKNDMNSIDRWGFVLGGEYQANSFLKLQAGYENHYRNLGDSEWKFRHRYHLGATAAFRYQWLKIALRERLQQTFDREESETRLRSRLKMSYVPTKGMVSPYFSVEVYQSLDDAPFWRADRIRYRPGVEIDLPKCWSLDVYYCYQHASRKSTHVAGLEVGYSF